MNILLFNTVIGTTNTGDAIIYESAKQGLRPLLELSYTMEFASHLKNLGALHYLTNSDKVKYCRNCDYKFIMGTNLLTSNMLRSIRQWPVGPIDRKIYRNSIMMGVGATYSDIHLDPLTRQMYQSILRKDVIHSVRDEDSKRLLESVPGIRAINTGCPTLWGMNQEACRRIPVTKSNKVIFSVSGYLRQKNEAYDRKMLEILEKNYEEAYLWVQTAKDEAYFESLGALKNAKKLYTLEQFESCCEAKDVDYIGTRLHGGIFAMQKGVRSLIVEIDHRAEGFRKTNHINTIKREEIEELESRILSEIRTDIHLDEEAISTWLGQFIPVGENSLLI